MPTLFDCPACNQGVPLTEAPRATEVECPFCGRTFTAFAELGSGPPPDYKLKKKGRRRGKDDDEEDEGGRGKPRHGSGGAGAMVVVVGSLGLLTVMAALGFVTWLIVSYDPSERTSTRTANRSTNAPTGPGGGAGAGGPQPRPGPTRPGNTRPGFPDTPTPGFGPNPDTVPDPGPRPKPKPKPKPTGFDLRPVAGPNTPIDPVQDVAAGSPRTVSLPGRVGQLAVGGRGRYVVMHIPERNQLTVFDVCTGQFPATVAAPPGNVLVAAGATKAVAVTEGQKNLQVYSLPDLKPGPAGFPEDSEFFFGPSAIAGGSNTDGPVFVQDFAGKVCLLDITDAPTMIPGSNADLGLRGGQARAAGDGRLFTVFTDNESWCLTEKNRKWAVMRLGLKYVVPSADGREAFGDTQIVTPDDGRVVAQRPAGELSWFVPAVHGNYFLKVTDQKVGEFPKTKETHALRVTVHAGRNVATPATPVTVTLPEGEKLIEFFGPPRVLHPLDRHLILVPEAKLLVQLPVSGEPRLILRRVIP